MLLFRQGWFAEVFFAEYCDLIDAGGLFFLLGGREGSTAWYAASRLDPTDLGTFSSVLTVTCSEVAGVFVSLGSCVERGAWVHVKSSVRCGSKGGERSCGLLAVKGSH